MSHEIITKINALESHIPDEHELAPNEQLPMAANPIVPLSGQLDIGVSSAAVMQDEEEDAIAYVSTTEVTSSLNGSSAASLEASEDVAVAPLMETRLQRSEIVAGITSSDDVNDLTAVVAETIGSNPLAKRLRSGKVYIAKVSKSSSKRMSQKDALRLHKQKALDSMFDQLQVLNDKGTFVPVDANSLSRCQVKKMIRSFMFLSEKLDPSGRLTKIKARLVAMGNGQDRSDVGVDISSPTVSTQSVYAVAAIAARERRKVLTGDVGSAFLNAYVPDGVEVPGGNRCDSIHTLCGYRRTGYVHPNIRPVLAVPHCN
jgi:translation initiation factor IF-1